MLNKIKNIFIGHNRDYIKEYTDKIDRNLNGEYLEEKEIDDIIDHMEDKLLCVLSLSEYQDNIEKIAIKFYDKHIGKGGHTPKL